MDRRQQKTRNAIFDAFTTLLARESYMKITVQEIIDEANIGRSTFYAHFATKDELLKELCRDLFHHVFSSTLETEHTHDFSSTPASSHTIIVHILYHLRDNKKNIIRILSCESSELFLSYFRKYLQELIITHIFQDIERKNKIMPEACLINHISCAFVGIIQWWIADGLHQSPEEVANYFESVIIPII